MTFTKHFIGVREEVLNFDLVVIDSNERKRPASIICSWSLCLSLRVATCRGVPFGTADGPYLAAPSSSAEEQIAAIGLESRHARSSRHLDLL